MGYKEVCESARFTCDSAHSAQRNLAFMMSLFISIKVNNRYYLSTDKNYLLEVFVTVSIFATEKETITNSLKRKIMATKFYKCNHCGNVIEKVVDSKVPVVCCGEKMEELVPNTVDASGEKHVPVVTRLDDCRIKVEVGSVAHPMTPEHHISFIYVETENGGIRVNLKDKPEAVVCVCSEKPIAVYEYCNLHGLWKTEL